MLLLFCTCFIFLLFLLNKNEKPFFITQLLNNEEIWDWLAIDRDSWEKISNLLLLVNCATLHTSSLYLFTKSLVQLYLKLNTVINNLNKKIYTLKNWHDLDKFLDQWATTIYRRFILRTIMFYLKCYPNHVAKNPADWIKQLLEWYCMFCCLYFVFIIILYSLSSWFVLNWIYTSYSSLFK